MAKALGAYFNVPLVETNGKELDCTITIYFRYLLAIGYEVRSNLPNEKNCFPEYSVQAVPPNCERLKNLVSQ